MQLSGLLVEEACLHLRRLNGIPDNVDDSGEGPDGATDDFAIDLQRALTATMARNGRRCDVRRTRQQSNATANVGTIKREINRTPGRITPTGCLHVWTSKPVGSYVCTLHMQHAKKDAETPCHVH